MGCASSKEAAAEPPKDPKAPIREISGPVAVVKTTPTLKKVQAGPLEGGVNTSSEKSPRSSGENAVKHRVQGAPRSGEIGTVNGPKPRTGEIVEEGFDEPAASQGAKCHLPQTPPKLKAPKSPLLEASSKQRHPPSKEGAQKEAVRTLEKDPARGSETALKPGGWKDLAALKLEKDAMAAAVSKPSILPPNIAVGRCGTVSFSNPLKTGGAAKPHSKTPPPTTSSFSRPKPPTFVAGWLASLNLSQYTAAFEAAGYDESDTLASLSQDDLVQIETYSNMTILPGHKKRLVLASSRPFTPGQSTPHSASQWDSNPPTPESVKVTESLRLSSELDTTSRGTESANSSPASVLPPLILPGNVLESRKGGAAPRSKINPPADGRPKTPPLWSSELPTPELPLPPTFGNGHLPFADLHSRGVNESSGLKEGVRVGSVEHFLVAPQMDKEPPRRVRRSPRPRRSPRRVISVKAASTWGGDSVSESEEFKEKGVTPQGQKVPVQLAGGGAQLADLQAHLQARVADLRLTQTQDEITPSGAKSLAPTHNEKLYKEKALANAVQQLVSHISVDSLA